VALRKPEISLPRNRSSVPEFLHGDCYVTEPNAREREKKREKGGATGEKEHEKERKGARERTGEEGRVKG